MKQLRTDEKNELSSDRDEILALLDDAIHEVRKRIQSYEVERPEDERLLIKWYQTLNTLRSERSTSMSSTKPKPSVSR